MRKDSRRPDQLRDMAFHLDWTQAPEGSVLVEAGNTRVLCTASLTEGVPRWRKDSGLGWVTAEYAMLPRATSTRSPRESTKGKVGGRTQEISRLIGRGLRAGVDYAKLGENMIEIDTPGRRRYPHRGDFRGLDCLGSRFASRAETRLHHRRSAA